MPSAAPASPKPWVQAASPSSPPRPNTRATGTRTTSTGTTATSTTSPVSPSPTPGWSLPVTARARCSAPPRTWSARSGTATASAPTLPPPHWPWTLHPPPPNSTPACHACWKTKVPCGTPSPSTKGWRHVWTAGSTPCGRGCGLARCAPRCSRTCAACSTRCASPRTRTSRT